MSYIYSIKVTLNTKDDVNKRFRDLGLNGELFISQNNELYICPKLSLSKWANFPQAKEPTSKIDPAWNQAIEETINYLVAEYNIKQPTSTACWQKFTASYRCPRMESFLREADINSW
jgi:ABC-type phosphate transport system ATPase subunit